MRGTGVFKGSQRMAGTHETFWQEDNCLCTMPVLSELHIRYPPWDQKTSREEKALNSVVNSLVVYLKADSISIVS